MDKNRFKEVLLSFEDELSSLDLETYAKCIDYQLMDLENLKKDNNNNEITIRSDYPDVVKHYK